MVILISVVYEFGAGISNGSMYLITSVKHALQLNYRKIRLTQTIVPKTEPRLNGPGKLPSIFFCNDMLIMCVG